MSKTLIAEKLGWHGDFKLDKIYTDDKQLEHAPEGASNNDLLDSIIDSKSESDEQKKYLKLLWREVLE